VLTRGGDQEESPGGGFHTPLLITTAGYWAWATFACFFLVEFVSFCYLRVFDHNQCNLAWILIGFMSWLGDDGGDMWAGVKFANVKIAVATPQKIAVAPQKIAVAVAAQKIAVAAPQKSVGKAVAVTPQKIVAGKVKGSGTTQSPQGKVVATQKKPPKPTAHPGVTAKQKKTKQPKVDQAKPIQKKETKLVEKTSVGPGAKRKPAPGII
jgi:hypothetical protein